MRSRTPEMAVREFHEAMGQDIDSPYNRDLLNLRLRLIREEFEELMDEAARVHLLGGFTPNFLKEMADLQYVLAGLAVTFGLPLQPAFNRVHASNMSKLGEDGKPLYREDGKVMKGPNYRPPVMDDLLRKS